MKKVIWLPSLALSLMMSQASFANMSATESSTNTKNSHNPSKNSCHQRMITMLRSLNLDDSQQAKIKDIKSQTMQSLHSQWQQMKSIRTQMNALVRSDKMDEAKLDSLISQKKELMATMMKTRMMAKHQMYGVLNDQQKSQFQDMMKKMESNMEKGC